jgi:hypothetical protein
MTRSFFIESLYIWKKLASHEIQHSIKILNAVLDFTFIISLLMYVLVIKKYSTLTHNFSFNIHAHDDGCIEDGSR